MMISFPTLLLRLGLALVLGALMGLERESTEHTAGLRTQALVALGSALFTIVSAFGFLAFLGIPHIQLDPTRIASYIVAGIGFLGAGTIFLSRHQERVKGLTTAATVWLVAAIGLACGAGLLLEAVAATVMALIVLIVLRYVERLILPHQSSDTHHLYIETTSAAGQFIGQVYDACARCGLTIETLEVRAEQDVNAVEVSCRIPNAPTLAQLVGELHALPGVRTVHADLRGTDIKDAIPKDTAGKAS